MHSCPESSAVAKPLRIVRMPEAVHRTGVSRSAIYERLDAHEFPRPVKLSKRAIGFVESEIDQLIENMVRQRDSTERA